MGWLGGDVVIVFVERAVGVVETTEERERTIKVVDRFDAWCFGSSLGPIWSQISRTIV